MNFFIAILVFLTLIVLILPVGIFYPNKLLHKHIVLLKDFSYKENKERSFINNLLSLSNKVYKISRIRLKSESYHKYEKMLILADMFDLLSVECLIGLKVMFLLITFVITFFLFLINPSIVTFIIIVLATVISYFCMDNIVFSRGKKRQIQMKIDLPGVLCTMAIITDSGLSFSDALKKICEIKKGTFIDEIKKAQNEIEIGELQKNALSKMADRCQVEEISIFIFAITQSIEKGSMGITKILKEQADELWEKRKNRARELGEKASMKLFLPMLLLVFPCFLIFILGPALISLMGFLMK